MFIGTSFWITCTRQPKTPEALFTNGKLRLVWHLRTLQNQVPTWIKFGSLLNQILNFTTMSERQDICLSLQCRYWRYSNSGIRFTCWYVCLPKPFLPLPHERDVELVLQWVQSTKAALCRGRGPKWRAYKTEIRVSWRSEVFKVLFKWKWYTVLLNCLFGFAVEF